MTLVHADTRIAVDAPIPAGLGDARDRRGPMRPVRLVSTRRRISGAVLARGFQAIDAGVAAGLAWVAAGLAAPGDGLADHALAALPFLAAGGLLIAALDALKAYDLRAREPVMRHLARVAAALIPPAVILIVGLVVAQAPASIAQVFAIDLIGAAGLFFGLHALWWALVRRARAAGRLTPNIVIVGATEKAARLIGRAMEAGDLAVLGIFDDRLERAPSALLGVPVLGDTQALVSHRIMPFVDRVVVTIAPGARARLQRLAEQLRVLPNEVTLLLEGEAAAIDRLVDLPLARLSGTPRRTLKAIAKRGQDLIVGLIGLAVAAPVMAVVAVAIALDSPGPIFFRQRRQGFNNEEIVVWKFRSMRVSAASEAETNARQVECDDPRVTRVGRFIRRTSLDELPQLFNVIAGEMSLVGPRPHAVNMQTGDAPSASLVADYAHRHRLKPGITGWAAIKGSRGPVDTPEAVRERVALDIEYIDRQNLWLDLYILLMTLPCLLGDRSAVR
jgi:Undecaprenyl-phosphate glucose phosphotransferase